MYTDAQRQNIEVVLNAFSDYIETSETSEVLFSEKLGYLFVGIDLRHRIASSGPEVIESAEDLLGLLINELLLDVLLSSRLDHTISSMNDAERQEFNQRLSPYIERLPQYRQFIYQYEKRELPCKS